MERSPDAQHRVGLLASEASETVRRKGATMRIRTVTFALEIPPGEYLSQATAIAPAFGAWPGLLAKWWLGDADSGTYGGVYLFATRDDADRSRETDLFRGMNTNPAFKDVTIREYDVLDAPTAITAPLRHEAARGRA